MREITDSPYAGEQFCFEHLELLEGTREGGLIQFGFHGEVVEMGLHPPLLPLHKGEQASEKMIALCPNGFGRRLGKRQIALERFRTLFDLPPFLVEGLDLFGSQCDVTGHQRE